MSCGDGRPHCTLQSTNLVVKQHGAVRVKQSIYHSARLVSPVPPSFRHQTSEVTKQGGPAHRHTVRQRFRPLGLGDLTEGLPDTYLRVGQMTLRHHYQNSG